MVETNINIADVKQGKEGGAGADINIQSSDGSLDITKVASDFDLKVVKQDKGGLQTNGLENHYFAINYTSTGIPASVGSYIPLYKISSHDNGKGQLGFEVFSREDTYGYYARYQFVCHGDRSLLVMVDWYNEGKSENAFKKNSIVVIKDPNRNRSWIILKRVEISGYDFFITSEFVKDIKYSYVCCYATWYEPNWIEGKIEKASAMTISSDSIILPIDLTCSNIKDGTGIESVTQVSSHAFGERSFAEGGQSIGEAVAAHLTKVLVGTAEGNVFTITGNSDYVEKLVGCPVSMTGENETMTFAKIVSFDGNKTVTLSSSVPREGNLQVYLGAISEYSHSEGKDNVAVGMFSHVEGVDNVANGLGSHVEGCNNASEDAIGSHIEGGQNRILGSYVRGSGGFIHVEGVDNTFDSPSQYAGNTHIEGAVNKVEAQNSHIEGVAHEVKMNDLLHVEGSYNRVDSHQSHIEGAAHYVKGGSIMHVEGVAHSIDTNGNNIHIEGATHHIDGGKDSHIEGVYNNVSDKMGYGYHVEGTAHDLPVPSYHTHVEGKRNHTAGNKNDGCHLEGTENTVENAEHSHIEGSGNKVTNEGTTISVVNNAHVEGGGNTAKGSCSHVEGGGNLATGTNSHVEGGGNVANGENSHAEGDHTIANNFAEHASGRYNESHTNDEVFGTTIFSVGIGNRGERKNAVEIGDDGSMFVLEERFDEEGRSLVPIKLQNKLKEITNIRTELDELVKEEFIGATGIIIEESSNPKWTRMGNLNAIDAVLHKYGSYVVDPIHKKYARLSESDHSFFADGTEWSGTYGEAMRRFPTLHYKVVHKDNGQKIIYGSEFDLGGHSFEEDWIGIYQGSLVDGKLHSRPNLAVTANRTMSQFWADAQATGTEFGLVNYFDFCKYNLMHLLAFGDANSDNTMGVGLYNNPSGGDFYNYVTGSTAILGDATGNTPYKQNTAYNQVKLFGIEGLAGGSWEFRPNIRFSGVNAIAYEGNIVSNTAEGRVFQRDPNTNLNNSFIKKTAIDEYADFIVIEGGGNSSSYYCDASWSASGGQLLLVGGNSNDGSSCGLSASASNSGFGAVFVIAGARLAFKNPEGYEEVSGADLANLNI